MNNTQYNKNAQRKENNIKEEINNICAIIIYLMFLLGFSIYLYKAINFIAQCFNTSISNTKMAIGLVISFLFLVLIIILMLFYSNKDDSKQVKRWYYSIMLILMLILSAITSAIMLYFIGSFLAKLLVKL